MQPEKRPRRIVAHSLATVVLFLSFQFNILSVVPSPAFFPTFDTASEEYVFARLSLARSEGAFSRPTRLGLATSATSEGHRLLYESGGVLRDVVWLRYGAQYGLQAVVLSVIDRALPFSPQVREWVMRALLTSGLSVVLVWIAAQISVGLGVPAFIGFVGFCALSPWLVAFASNLYWVAMLWFLPLGISLALCSALTGGVAGGRIVTPLAAALFATFLSRFLSGYEYITSVVLSALTAPVFEAVRSHWPARRFIIVAAGIVAIAAAAFFLALLCQFLELGSLDLLKGRFQQRMVGLPAIDGNSLDYLAHFANKLNIISSYVFSAPVQKEMGTQTFWIIGGLYAALVCLLDRRWLWPLGNRRGRLVPLAAATLFAIFAPLSWFLIGSAHSYIHPQINPILWTLPFLPMAAALMFALAWSIFQSVPRLLFHPAASAVTVSLTALPVALCVYLALDARKAKSIPTWLAEQYAGATPLIGGSLPISLRIRPGMLLARGECDAPAMSTITDIRYNAEEAADRVVLMTQSPRTFFHERTGVCYALRGAPSSIPDLVTVTQSGVQHDFTPLR